MKHFRPPEVKRPFRPPPDCVLTPEQEDLVNDFLAVLDYSPESLQCLRRLLWELDRCNLRMASYRLAIATCPINWAWTTEKPKPASDADSDETL